MLLFCVGSWKHGLGSEHLCLFSHFNALPPLNDCVCAVVPIFHFWKSSKYNLLFKWWCHNSLPLHMIYEQFSNKEIIQDSGSSSHSWLFFILVWTALIKKSIFMNYKKKKKTKLETSVSVYWKSNTNTKIVFSLIFGNCNKAFFTV